MLYYGIRNFKKTVNAFNNRKKCIEPNIYNISLRWQ